MAKKTKEREEFAQWVQWQINKAGGYRVAAKKSDVAHGTLIRATQGEPLNLATMEKISKWTSISLSRLLRLYGVEVEDDRKLESTVARILEQRPELKEALEKAVDVLDDDAMCSVLDYIRFQIWQVEQKTSSTNLGE